MRASARKRARMTGRGGKSSPFVQILHRVIDTPQFAAMSGSALKMLVDLARQFNGRNNGMFSMSNPDFNIRGRWRSNSKRERAIHELLEGGWIIKTKLGGRGIGCDRYAITWWPVDEARHDHQVETVASNLWMKNSASPNRGQADPETGTAEPKNRSMSDHLVPESGTKSALFRAA